MTTRATAARGATLSPSTARPASRDRSRRSSEGLRGTVSVARVQLTYGGSGTLLSTLTVRAQPRRPLHRRRRQLRRHRPWSRGLVDEVLAMATMRPVIAVKQGQPQDRSTELPRSPPHRRAAGQVSAIPKPRRSARSRRRRRRTWDSGTTSPGRPPYSSRLSTIWATT